MRISILKELEQKLKLRTLRTFTRLPTASAFTILFMFWSIVLLIKQVVKNNNESSKGQNTAILGAAFVGSLSFAFTDSFWFNAVETEVYAMATLIMGTVLSMAHSNGDAHRGVDSSRD